MFGLRPDKPIISYKHRKPKVHLIHWTCQTSQLSPAGRKWAQNTYISLHLGLYLQCHLKSNCLSRLTRSKRHKWAFLDMMGCDNTKHSTHRTLAPQCTEGASCSPSWWRDSPGAAPCCSCPASEKSIVLYIAAQTVFRIQSAVSTERRSLSHLCNVKPSLGQEPPVHNSLFSLIILISALLLCVLGEFFWFWPSVPPVFCCIQLAVCCRLSGY